MKKTLFALLSLSFASLSFAGGDACKSAAKCDDKDAKACCCCCCSCCNGAKDDKGCATDKAACDDKADAKRDATSPAMPEKK
jgi:hypothetical protein